MLRDDFIRVRHMLDAAKEAISFVDNKTRDDLENNRMLALSIVKSIEIVGEAASKVTKGSREEHPEIPWTDIVAMRNSSENKFKSAGRFIFQSLSSGAVAEGSRLGEGRES
jgi:uncharacterized protein with HEPN domain